MFAPVAPRIESIDLRYCSVEEIMREARGARLIVADPPWRYSQAPGVANPEEEGIYTGLPDAEIVEHLDQAFACSAPSARLAVWYTFPKLAEWSSAGWAGKRWGEVVSGGAWVKTGGSGVGYHWRGRAEPVALFTRGPTGRPSETFGNGHASPAEDHSEKPVAWMRAWVRAWTNPGDLVLDLYAGMAPVARACLLEGRRYLGAEIDPTRHAQAMDRLHMARRKG